jgi:lipoprotein-releasing system permease protein
MISYNFFLSKKLAGRKREDNFLWFINVFSIAGIAIGVVALMLVIGVMNGFSKELKKKIIGANPTVTIEGRPYISDYKQIIPAVKSEVSEIQGISPYLSTQVIYKSSKYVLGGILKGVEPESEKEVTNIAKFMKEGTIQDLDKGIVLGSELAGELGVNIGDFISVIGWGAVPKQKKLPVTGIVEYGVYSFDASMGFVSLNSVMDFLRTGDRVHAIGISIGNIYNSGKVAEKIRVFLNDKYSVTTWVEKNKILFAALALEKKAMAVILSLIILVASFNIASTLMITIYRKVKEIGILRAIGLSSTEIRKVFFYQGLILGLKGLLWGLFTGGLLAWVVRQYQFISLPEFIYDLSRLPIEISAADIAWICLAVIFIVSFASLYPAQRASRLNPAEAIRNE